MAAARATPRVFSLTLITILWCCFADAQSLNLGLHARAFRFLSQDGHNAYSEPVSEGGFGFGPWAPSVDVEVRYSPYRSILAVAGDLSYTPLKGSGTVHYIDESGSPMGAREYEGHLFTASFGAQFKMLQGPIRPYLGGRLQWSFMSDVTVDYTGEAHSEMLPHHFDGFISLGAGVLGGVEVDLGSSWSLDIIGRYNFTNVENPSDPAYGNALSIGVGVFYELL